jgi:hypothetical protein
VVLNHPDLSTTLTAISIIVVLFVGSYLQVTVLEDNIEDIEDMRTTL